MSEDKDCSPKQTENPCPVEVECPTCGGRKRIYEDAADAFGRPCPDCTPENVEEP